MGIFGREEHLRVVGCRIAKAPDRIMRGIRSVFDIAGTRTRLVIVDLLCGRSRRMMSRITMEGFVKDLSRRGTSTIVHKIPLAVRVAKVLPSVIGGYIRGLVGCSTVRVIANDLSLRGIGGTAIVTRILKTIFSMVRRRAA